MVTNVNCCSSNNHRGHSRTSWIYTVTYERIHERARVYTREALGFDYVSRLDSGHLALFNGGQKVVL